MICFIVGNQCGFGAEDRLGEGTGCGGIEAEKPVRSGQLSSERWHHLG